ncbi:hypothetical protein EDD86DRAFT_201434 [Gorgonomyces haynaldii]|nr:hypothetical protein EDD86DRAFT_201434 [Gorgonomyces haynaldii]
MNQQVLREACQVTLGYFGVFLLTILFQVYLKAKTIIDHRQKKQQGSKEKLDIYNSPIMLIGNRSTGNFVEWQTIFLGLFWMNAILNGTYLWVGWIGVGARLAYPIFALIGGIKQSGANGPIFLATIPHYAVMTFYSYQVYQAVGMPTF